MAAPNYTTNLATLEDFEVSATTNNFTNYANNNSGKIVEDDTDFPIQSTHHASSEMRTAETASICVDNGSNITWTSGWNMFIWGVFLPANAVDTDANGGLVMMVGASTSSFYQWTVGGKDFGRYPYGGWQNFVADPEVTNGRTTVGSPGTSYRWCGIGFDITSAISKGNPMGIDVVRYGRGDVVITAGDSGSGYATFVGMAAQNDNSANKWGLFQENGGGYLWKGLLSFGTAATSTDFRDANRVIVIDNTRRVATDFNRIEITNASSNIEWDTVLVSSLSTQSKGEFECIDNATVAKVSCIFTDMSTFIYQSNSDMTGCTYRRCGQVTQGSASFDACFFDSSSATKALAVDTIADVTNCTFSSSGTGYAIEGFSVAGEYTLTGLTFTGYASTNGTTGNEAIHVTATTGIVNLNLSGGNTPTIHTAGATVNVVQSAVLTLGRIRATSDAYVYRADTKALLSNVSPVTVTDFVNDEGIQFYKHVYSYNAATLSGVGVELKVLSEAYENVRQNYTLTADDARVEFQQRTDRNYENPD